MVMRSDIVSGIDRTSKEAHSERPGSVPPQSSEREGAGDDGQSFRRPSDGDDSRKGLSSQADGPRRGSRPSYVQDKPSSAEAVYEVGTSTTSSKGKSRQPSLMEVPSTESESGAIPPEPALPAAPKLPRRDI